MTRTLILTLLVFVISGCGGQVSSPPSTKTKTSAPVAESKPIAEPTPEKRFKKRVRQDERPEIVFPEIPAGVKEMTAKEIEFLGNEGKPGLRGLPCIFESTSDIFVVYYTGDPNMVSMVVTDKQGDPFRLAFLSKDKYGRELAKLRKGTPILMVGNLSVRQQTNFFMVDDLILSNK